MTFAFTDYLDMLKHVQQEQENVQNGLTPTPYPFYREQLSFTYKGELVAKERPRKAKNGQMYTPQRTRNFEKKIAKWGASKMVELPPLPFPIKVSLQVFDATDNQDAVLHSFAGLTYNTKTDVDNYAKAILDGLNKVVWKDDKLICDLRVTRVWAKSPGFRLYVFRAGLSEMEYQNFLKVWRNKEKYHAKNAG